MYVENLGSRSPQPTLPIYEDVRVVPDSSTLEPLQESAPGHNESPTTTVPPVAVEGSERHLNVPPPPPPPPPNLSPQCEADSIHIYALPIHKDARRAADSSLVSTPEPSQEPAPDHDNSPTTTVPPDPRRVSDIHPNAPPHHAPLSLLPHSLLCPLSSPQCEVDSSVSAYAVTSVSTSSATPPPPAADGVVYAEPKGFKNPQVL